jgi:lipoate-protein ligase A
MATDEALLEAGPRFGQPVLRFYGWREAAASFGYFQRFTEVERLTSLRPLIRRPTGGGVVPHDRDWTYSLVFPANHPWYELKALQSYERVHQWIQSAFALERVSTELAAPPRQKSSGQCFVGAERFDLVWHERKIAGAAQRRTRHGLLIQGSIQPPSGITRSRFEEAFCRVPTEQWEVEWESFQPDDPLLANIADLAAGKYAQDWFNRRR